MPHIRPKGDKYQAIIKYRKQTVYRTFDTKGIAQKEAIKILRRMETGENVDAYDPTVEEAIDKYMDEIAPLQADSGKTRRNSNSKTIKKYLGAVRLSHLDADTVIELYVAPRLRLVSPDSLRRELSLISQTVQVAGIRQNPIPLVRRRLFQQRQLAPPARRDRRLSSHEESRLLESCSSISPELRLIVELVLQTGLRRGELGKWELRPKQLLIKQSKTGKTRGVPLTREALRIIEQLSQGIMLSPQLISRKFKEACDNADIKDLHFHDLRGEAAHRMLDGKIYRRKGEPYRCTIDEVANILGNSVRVLSEHYANAYSFDDLS